MEIYSLLFVSVLNYSFSTSKCMKSKHKVSAHGSDIKEIHLERMLILPLLSAYDYYAPITLSLLLGKSTQM